MTRKVQIYYATPRGRATSTFIELDDTISSIVRVYRSLLCRSAREFASLRHGLRRYRDGGCRRRGGRTDVAVGGADPIGVACLHAAARDGVG